jgi:hypothetical protein
MKEKSWIIPCLLLTAMLVAAISQMPIAKAAGTTLTIVQSITELGPQNAVGTNFTVSCFIENVAELYGVDIQIGWTTEYIEYVSHVKMIPANTSAGGLLYSPTIPVSDQVDETASMPGSEPGTMYWLAEASMGAPKFNGNGTAFNMTFRVKNHPMGADSHIYINVTSSTLANFGGSPISHTITNAHILLHARPQPAGPTIQVASVSHKGAVPYAFQTNVSILNLDSYWDLGGYDIQLTYSPEVIQAALITVDPDGWFASFWPGGPFIVKNETDNDAGIVWVALIGLPDSDGTHSPPSGNATLFTVDFTALASGPLEIETESPRYLAGYPHPERSESPYDNQDVAIPIPYNATDGLANIVGVTAHSILSHIVTTESNSSVSSIFFTPGVPMLYFNVTGANGHTGFCNITIPKNFMWSTIADGWFVLVNGELVQPQIVTDATNTYIYFTYHHSRNNVTIVTSNAIPEFYTSMFAITLLTATAIGLALRRKLTKKKGF